MSRGKRSFGYNDAGASLEKLESMIPEVDIHGLVHYPGYYLTMCPAASWGSGDESGRQFMPPRGSCGRDMGDGVVLRSSDR